MNTNKCLALLPAFFLCITMVAQAPDYVYTEASEFTLTGKLMNTPNPYHRVDTVRFKGFTTTENTQVRNSWE